MGRVYGAGAPRRDRVRAPCLNEVTLTAEPTPRKVLALPAPLRERLLAHAREEAPRECVGLLGGRVEEGGAPRAVTLYPLENVAPDPLRAYRADELGLLRALKAMRREGLSLVGIYHSHPRGPQEPSDADVRLAAYAVPYLIADLSAGTLRAFLLPRRDEVTLT